jgi:hypothetical protein
MSYETPWRSLGETAGGFRNADKIERNRITCRLGDTTGAYHRQGVGRSFRAAEECDNYAASASSNALASFRSRVLKPSVNQL